ncbi:MAG: TetR family transcriptional regulator, partial [Nocardioidaceae bacterium]
MPLNRARVLDSGLAYVDEHGLDALSMHKLGAHLGVRGMSLYNHVEGKDDLLDGISALLWGEIDVAALRERHW